MKKVQYKKLGVQKVHYKNIIIKKLLIQGWWDIDIFMWGCLSEGMVGY